MSADRRWLEAIWPWVREQLPPPPAEALDLGCGPQGGFVPMLLSEGHSAVGVDPRAPAGAEYRQVPFERYEPSGRLDAVIASTSLHHVADLAAALDRISDLLAPGGVLIVVEWAWERVDEATARWCFERLGDETGGGWLLNRKREWEASAASWDAYFTAWARGHGLHSSDEIFGELDRRFERRLAADGPYFYAELAGVNEADELAAIAAGAIRAAGRRYVGLAGG